MTEDAVRDIFNNGGQVHELPPVLGDKCPVKALGHKDGGTFYFLNAAGQIIDLTPSKFSSNGVTALFMGDLDYLTRQWQLDNNRRNGKTPWDNPQAAADLMRACRLAGHFDPVDETRGRGAWHDDASDPAGLIVHLGNTIHHYTYTDGKMKRSELPSGQRIGRYVYADARPEPAPDPSNEMVPIDAGRSLLAFFESCAWKFKKTDPTLILGAAALGFVTGAAPFRPPIWLTGPSGAGKSAVIRALRKIYRQLCLYYDDPTKAGVREQVGFDARVVILDEFEAKERNAKAADLVELARFTYSREGGRYVRAGSDGHQGQTHALFVFSSVEPPMVLKQDANRRVVLELVKKDWDKDAAHRLEKRLVEIGQLGPQVQRRIYEQWGRFPEAFAAYRAALMAVGHDSRGGDTYGAVLAAADILVSDQPVDIDTAMEWADRLSPANLGTRDDTPDAHAACWNHLLTQPPERMPGGERRLVGDLLSELCFEGNSECAAALRKAGLCVVDHEGQKYVAVANQHAGLNSLFIGTRWHGGGWRTVLRRIPMAQASPGVIRFAGLASRATLVPVACVPESIRPPTPDREEISV